MRLGVKAYFRIRHCEERTARRSNLGFALPEIASLHFVPLAMTV